MALCEAGKRVAKDGSSIYREPAMSLFGILKGVLGIPHYAGIEGCRQEAEAGKRQRQARRKPSSPWVAFTSAASLGCHRITLNRVASVSLRSAKKRRPGRISAFCGARRVTLASQPLPDAAMAC